MGNMRNAYKYFVRKSEERDLCGGLGLAARITLKLIADDCGVIVCTGLIGFRLVRDIRWTLVTVILNFWVP